METDVSLTEKKRRAEQAWRGLGVAWRGAVWSVEGVANGSSAARGPVGDAILSGEVPYGEASDTPPKTGLGPKM
ncbi:hypothetical protein LSTR_LSTR002204 [Laodelphax striatellus]|uniref:Uncharacterized protein n=1 Tax=Laodelphax striatellus TaxID=195883 RepID=A0A482XRQ5_LAOST|nr:hypothetical protein LSTR_LSTR002204 [Laodelphax striatellus]